ncbi:hypothetical protein Aca07nite_26420 [Actinoplanes capillaceus]|uniref:Lipoprotein n=1 Tax=Actinoplanes campanulatus TaxID=113559 RepID=A0ABQ3WEE7_9ACTN|nr:hypothetical protein [Actinoplanes capillaceus]GID45367.1 hypothetical protein Aca07nite_26420 [Actinoplanes capillaceus]
MRRTYMIAVAVAGVTLVTGCANGPERVAGDAVPHGGATPAASVSVAASVTPAVTSPSPSRTSSTPKSSATAAPRQFTPAGYGALKLGMSGKQALATGLVRNQSGSGDACSTFELIPAKRKGVSVVLSKRMGIVTIPAPAWVPTPEGIRAGSTVKQVQDAYSDLDGDVNDPLNTFPLIANQNDGDDSRYLIYIEDGKVDAVFVERNGADC